MASKPCKNLAFHVKTSRACHSNVGMRGAWNLCTAARKGRQPKATTMKTYWVYMMQSANNRALYIGVTNNLDRRVREHKEGSGSVFTAKYKCHKLVYYEEFGLIDQAILREKKLKKLSRANKEKLINAMNPQRIDLLEQQ
jgi:putative endonuclease